MSVGGTKVFLDLAYIAALFRMPGLSAVVQPCFGPTSFLSEEKRYT